MGQNALALFHPPEAQPSQITTKIDTQVEHLNFCVNTTARNFKDLLKSFQEGEIG